MPNTELYSEKLFKKTAGTIFQYRYVIWGTLLIGLLAYAYTFTNKLPNHDDLYYLFGKGTSVASGRFGLDILSFFLPDFSMPWIYGIFSLIAIAAGNCLIVKLFGIRTPVLQFLLGGIIISFPSEIGTMSYMFTACPYAIAYFLSILSVYYLAKESWKYDFAALLALVGSLSIYQSYLAITVSFLIIYLIYRLISNQGSAKTLFWLGVRFVCFLLLALGAYWIILQIIFMVTGTSMGGYASGALSMENLSILNRIKLAYVACFNTFRSRYYGLVSSRLALYLHPIICVLAGIQLLMYAIRRKDPADILLLLFLLLVLPLGINCVFFIVEEYSIHSLVLYSNIAIYVLWVFLVENGLLQNFSRTLLQTLHGIRLDCIVAGMAIIMMGNVYRANEASLLQQLSYENLHSFSTSVMTQLQSMPEYTSDSKVSIVGKYNFPEFHNQFIDAAEITGIGTIGPDTYFMECFIEYYTGTPLNWVEPEICIGLLDEDAFKAMPSYPNHGYIAQINDIFVVKLSDALPN